MIARRAVARGPAPSPGRIRRCVTSCVTTTANTDARTRTWTDVVRRVTCAFRQAAGGVSLLDTEEGTGSIPVSPTSENGLSRSWERPFDTESDNNAGARCRASAFVGGRASVTCVLATAIGRPLGRLEVGSAAGGVVDPADRGGDLGVEHLAVDAQRHGDVGVTEDDLRVPGRDSEALEHRGRGAAQVVEHDVRQAGRCDDAVEGAG